jgi:hypothetical protein
MLYRVGHVSVTAFAEGWLRGVRRARANAACSWVNLALVAGDALRQALHNRHLICGSILALSLRHQAL